jgi:hypothetical protein
MVGYGVAHRQAVARRTTTDVSFGSMLLKSRRQEPNAQQTNQGGLLVDSTLRELLASLIKNCAAAPSKSFFNRIGQNEKNSPRAHVVRFTPKRWGNRPASLWIAEDFGCCASG